MYLTKIDLSIGNRGIQRALGDCQELHRIVMGLFEASRKDAGVLYRLRVDCGSGEMKRRSTSTPPSRSERRSCCQGCGFPGSGICLIGC